MCIAYYFDKLIFIFPPLNVFWKKKTEGVVPTGYGILLVIVCWMTQASLNIEHGELGKLPPEGTQDQEVQQLEEGGVALVRQRGSSLQAASKQDLTSTIEYLASGLICPICFHLLPLSLLVLPSHLAPSGNYLLFLIQSGFQNQNCNVLDVIMNKNNQWYRLHCNNCWCYQCTVYEVNVSIR